MRAGDENSTRNVLLTMLKTGGSLTVGDMAARLGITAMAVRRHLHALQRDGIVSARAVRQSVGRPMYRYALTEQSDTLFPRNYHQLALDLLEQLDEGRESEAVGRFFQKRKQKLIGKYSDAVSGDSLSDKVERLAAIQNAGGYMADWESGSGGHYVINEYNCPIAHVASKYTQACDSELELFEELLDAHVERVECLAKQGVVCKYIIRSK